MISQSCVNCGGKEFETSFNTYNQQERKCKSCGWITAFMFREKIQAPPAEERYEDRY